MGNFLEFFSENLSNFTVEFISAAASWVIALIFTQIIAARIKRRQFYNDTSLFFASLNRLRQKGKLDSHVVKTIVQSYSEIFSRNFIRQRWYSRMGLPKATELQGEAAQCWVCGEDSVKVAGKCRDCELDCCAWDKSELRGFARVNTLIDDLR